MRRWTFLQMDHYSVPHSEISKMVALTNEALFTASQWESGDGSTYKWNTIQYLRVRMWKMDSLTNGNLFTSLQCQCGDGRSYKWTTIFWFTVTVRIWTLLGMDQNSLPHGDSVEVDALTNRPLFTASQWQCGDGRSYKWSTVDCLTMTVWRWTLLQIENYSLPHSESAKMDALTNEALFATSQWECGDGRFYKWNTIFWFTLTVRRSTLLLLDNYSQPHRDSTNMDAPRNGPKFIASQWQCGDGRSYKWTTIHCLTVIVWTWMLLERNNCSLPQSYSGNMATLTSGPLFTASSS